LTTQHGKKKVWYAPNKFEAYGQEEIDAVVACLKDGWLAPGPRMAKFEHTVARYFFKQCGLMVNSGSSANLIGLAVLGLVPGCVACSRKSIGPALPVVPLPSHLQRVFIGLVVAVTRL
jgi:CDP-6-deoxy-D-xylo-4-hexulose-3-dehydrase